MTEREAIEAMDRMDAAKLAALRNPLSYREGYAAYGDCAPISNCPRVADLEVCADWRAGWLAARDDFRREG